MTDLRQEMADVLVTCLLNNEMFIPAKKIAQKNQAKPKHMYVNTKIVQILFLSLSLYICIK